MNSPSSESYTTYVSPLGSRNASAEMQAIWSPQRKHSTWRRLWLALAEAQQQLGLPITDEQVSELRAHLNDIDFARAAEHEARLRHDVMAHIHTLGEVAPTARPIIHLGATSQFVNCNTEIILLRDALRLTAGKIACIIDALGSFALRYRALPTLGFTHYQPAQPTTVGKRATLWANDLALALDEIEVRIDRLRLRGAKGATGTQASFLSLFDGDAGKVEELDRLVISKMGFADKGAYAVTGQTYPRLVDAQVLNAAAVVAAALHKIATDLRLLANRKELEEPFGASQVGSSAMPYKRNPMRCERICALSRFVMSMPANALQTAATQWMERTLDDSANRRLTLPETFLALDGALDLMHNVAAGLVVHEPVIAANLLAELPFMATENLLMAAVRNGADRQEVHELIRTHSQAAGQRVKAEGKANDLIDRLRAEPAFAGVDFDRVMQPGQYVGLAPQQTDRFIEQVVEPIRRRYADSLHGPAEPRV
ncbi:MAG: adenylosuccinate lyase [Phycisphaerales bacterium]|nr:adenylosuccinate lyase [Phycisphaerales bacterium]